MRQKNFLNYVLNIVPLLLVGGVLVYAAAPAGGYLPGATNDPDCVPGTTDCFVKVVTTQGSEYGDIKQGMQSSDHNGWIKLDGRAKSTLTSTQQAQATALGIGVNLPNASNAQLTQNGNALGSVVGSNTKNIIRANLPSFTLGGTTSSAGAHTHALDRRSNTDAGAYDPGDARASESSAATTDRNLYSNAFSTKSAGAHTHTITTDNINGGVSQQAFDVRGQELSVNMFIYLGQ